MLPNVLVFARLNPESGMFERTVVDLPPISTKLEVFILPATHFAARSDPMPGRGVRVRAGERLEEGEVIGCYGGSVATAARGEHCWSLGPQPDAPVVDASLLGNETSLINDGRYGGGPGANCDARTVWLSGLLAIQIYAVRPIGEHEELLLDYGDDFWIKRHDPPRSTD